MGRPKPAESLQPGLEGGSIEVRYMVPKLCRLCKLTKPVPEQDDVCEGCWSLRMAGQALVTCPFYLFEEPGAYDGGRAPIELCYSCAWRTGWTEELAPTCNHPIAVDIVERWDVEFVHCPKESTLAGESRWVPFDICKECRWHRGELVIGEGRFVYCGVPYEKTVRPAGEALERKRDLPAKDKPSVEPEPATAQLKESGS